MAYTMAAEGYGKYKSVNTSKVFIHFEICVLKTVFDFGMGSRVWRYLLAVLHKQAKAFKTKVFTCIF